MNYKDYINARNLSWNILIQENITSLPVDISSLCKNLGIMIKHYAGRENSDGECLYVDNIPYIFVKQNCTKQRKRFTIAHELGHFLLGHVGKYKLVSREPSPSDNPIEQEANIFASRLLAPACVLWGCNAKTAEDIALLCDISLQSAQYRMKRMKELYKRDKFLTSPLERMVFEQFEDYITSHRLN